MICGLALEATLVATARCACSSDVLRSTGGGKIDEQANADARQQDEATKATHTSQLPALPIGTISVPDRERVTALNSSVSRP